MIVFYLFLRCILFIRDDMKNLKFLAMLLFTALASSAWAAEITIEGDGALNAIVTDNFYAAIGREFHGNTPGTSGIININGGIITATGGKFAAGIGGSDTGAGGTININGGTIVATGGYLAAGIGG